MRRIGNFAGATMVVLGAISAGLFASIPPASARGFGNECPHVLGTAGGTVSLRCRGVGMGTAPGSTFTPGNDTGTITFVTRGHTYSTTISVAVTDETRANQPPADYCVRQGHGLQYDMTGTVTSNMDPKISGTTVSGTLCIDSAGNIRQAHYGGISF